MSCNRTVSPVSLEMFKGAAKTFQISVFDDGNPVDLSGLTLRFVVHDDNDPPVGEFKVDDAEITVEGANNEIASVAVAPAKTTEANANLHCELWDVTQAGAEKVLAHGSLAVKPAVKDIQ